MKNLLYLPFFALLISLLSFKETDDRKSRLPYMVTESKADKRLHSDESVFEFFFQKQYSDTVTDSIRLSYNGNLETVKPDQNGTASIKVKPGKYKFQFFYNSSYFEITTDSITIQPGYRTKMTVYFESSVVPVISLKPVIYVYPEKTEAIEIRLDLKGEIGFTYPKYENGWNFTAGPDGKIHQNGKEYDYLFWDGKTNLDAAAINWKEGFIVRKDSLVPFFEKHLSAMGLNPREINDYITFWCPLMQANELNYVHFIFNEEYNTYANLTVNPKPDKMFRVYMVWSKADALMQVKEQKLESFVRSGFTLVEWGGAEVEDMRLVNR